MNKDEGTYKLDRVYRQIIQNWQPKELMTSSLSSRVASKAVVVGTFFHVDMSIY